KSEEGRDMVLLAIADEQTIKQLDRYKGMLNALTDPRKTSEADAQRLLHTAKPVYYITSGIHSPEFGGPEMLMELAYRLVVEWTPTILHDLHEAVTYLYASTGTGPYNDALDPITVDEWWMLAKNDVMEMTKRGVPGVWTYGFYDGWVPNYLFFIAHTHNAVGRFYEVQSYGPDNYEVRPPVTTTSREWFRPNPPLPYIKWGARNNTNIQESAILFALNHV